MSHYSESLTWRAWGRGWKAKGARTTYFIRVEKPRFRRGESQGVYALYKGRKFIAGFDSRWQAQYAAERHELAPRPIGVTTSEWSRYHKRKHGMLDPRRHRKGARRDPSASFIAIEFDLRRGERTGNRMIFLADDLKDAASKCAYTLNLKSAGWRVSPSGRTVQHRTGDLGWHIVKEGSPAARSMGLDPRRRHPRARRRR